MKITTGKIPEKTSGGRGRPRIDSNPGMATRLERILPMMSYGNMSVKEGVKVVGCSIRSFDRYLRAWRYKQIELEKERVRSGLRRAR